jgi:hypothetical protein
VNASKISTTSVQHSAMMKSNAASIKMKQSYSSDWSGYSIGGDAGSVTNVKGSWTVPAIVKNKLPNQASSNWIGMDGDTSQTVEQLGTASATDEKGNPVYYAWYEYYPASSYTIPMAIKPGDKIVADIDYANNQLVMSMTNQNTGEVFSISRDGREYTRSSAEWICEAPYYNGVLPLANFGVTFFGNTYTGATNTCFATVNGQTGDINDFGANVNLITMVNDKGEVKAVPTPLGDGGSSFAVSWRRAA